MRLRYINTSTSLPVDDALERHLHRVMAGGTANLLFVADSRDRLHRRRRGEAEWDCDILFVSAPELDRERRAATEERQRAREERRRPAGEPHLPPEERVGEAEGEWPRTTEVDPVGLYFSCHPEFGRPLIKISPEKVMQVAADLRWRRGVTLPLTEVFPLLLTGVVVHELGHWVMDDRQDREDDRREHWESAARNADEPDDRASGWRRQRHQEWQALLRRPSPGCQPAEHQPGREEALHHHIVEESLCNALKLAQRLMPEERAVLEVSVRHAPPGYSAGVLWQMPEAHLLRAMSAWREHKSTLRGLRRDWGDLLLPTGAPAHRLAQTLLRGIPVTQIPDFEKDLHLFVAAQLPAMVGDWQRDPARYDAPLNGGSGVYDWLCHRARWHDSGLTAEDQARWLEEWAGHAPTGTRHAAEFRR